MKRAILILVFTCVASFVLAQKSIVLRLKLPDGSIASNYFFASNLNGWNPSHVDFKFKSNSNNVYEFQLPQTTLELVEFKITRGSWESVESTLTGNDIGNRILKIEEIKSDTIIDIIIAGWKDKFANSTKQSTASENVKIISEHFPLLKLGKTRRIWIYLPEGYENSNKKYPVIYMHDGQNLFDVLTGPFGEWGVDECLDTLSEKIKFETIIVGIDNGLADRLSEYSPYNFKVNADEENVWDVKGTGTQYLESLVYDLKPFIDKNYRTKSDAKYTSVCGSSMGGLISLYAVMRYPSVFGSAGVFSPAFWTNENDLQAEIKNNKTGWSGNIYMISGELEGKKYTENMFDIADMLIQEKKKNIKSISIPNGQHNEAFWRRAFPDFYLWLSKIQ